MGVIKTGTLVAGRVSQIANRNRRRWRALRVMVRDRPSLFRWLLSLRKVQIILACVILAGIFVVPPVALVTADLVHPPKLRGVFKKKSVRTARSRSLQGTLASYYWILSVGSLLVMVWRRLPQWDGSDEEPMDDDSGEGTADDGMATAKTVLSEAVAETVASDILGEDAARTSVVLPSCERYKVLAEIGRGGMGVVYRAEDTLLNRSVALKSLSFGGSAHSSATQRFVREAQALAQLTHPCIVQVYDLAEMDGDLFMAMELVDGRDLSEHLADSGAFGVHEALSLGVAMAEALAYAHGRGVVHRDFKPGNVLLAQGGVPKVMDFGLAKIAREPSMTMQGAVMGSPAYMSPEQASGSGTDERTDIYALGVTLYEMIAGAPPYTGDPMQVMMKHISQPHPDLREKAKGVPDELADLLDQMLAKSPDDRIEKMESVASALSVILADLTDDRSS